jgi:hypothetical protein
MKSVLGLLLLAASVAAQNTTAVRKLNSTLLTLKDGAARDSVGRQLAADLSAVADPDHRPTLYILTKLADSLVTAVPVRNLRVELLSPVTGRIVDVLHSAGTSTVGFYEAVGAAEKALTAMGVAAPQAHSIADALTTLGQQVRGPDDSPVKELGRERPMR